MRKPEYGIVFPQVHDLQELNVMLAEKLEEWAHGYKAEGVQEGIEQGKPKQAKCCLCKNCYQNVLAQSHRK